MADELIAEYDAFQDNPWPIIYQEIDKKYPGSKFILLLRDSDSWIKSQVKHFGKRKTSMRQWIYGDKYGFPEGNEDLYLKRYNDHNIGVVNYFRKRKDDLLVMDLMKGDGWDFLCPFLGVDVPKIAFLHVNKAEKREKKEAVRQKA